MNLIKKVLITGWRWFNQTLIFFIPLADLLARIWVAKAFWYSAQVKIQSWTSTVMLFRHEYVVPLLPPYWAALIGTIVELLAPIFLVLGLGGRLPAFVLFIFNIVAVISYPFLWTPDGAEGFEDHVAWGVVLMLLMCYGSGKLSLDQALKWLYRRVKAK